MSQTEKIDILDRTKIMSDIEQILVLLSEQKQGRVFALDGKWGYGKTYILEQLEKKLVGLQKEGTNDDRFYVFHYNCWQYDYYEEPAVAIVSAMLEKRGKDNKAEMALQKEYTDLKTVLGKIAGEFTKNKRIKATKEKIHSILMKCLLSKKRWILHEIKSENYQKIKQYY